MRLDNDRKRMQASRESVANVWCHKCKNEVSTIASNEVSSEQICICVSFGVVGLIPCMCIPFCIKSCFDLRHRCSKCKKTLFHDINEGDDILDNGNGGPDIINIDISI